MQRRYLYILMFSLPGFLASLMISIVLSASIAGIFWLFVFGDDPWPVSADRTLAIIFIFSLLVLWGAFQYLAYRTGRKEEANASLSVRHAVIAAGVTALLSLVIIFHQWRAGNIGTPSNSVMCSEHCRDQGFSGSGIPPRNSGLEICICYDAQGREAVKSPLSSIQSQHRKLSRNPFAKIFQF